MKNLYIVLIFSFFYFNSLKAQNDVIIWLDNSGSINEEEWNDMVSSVNAIIQEVLNCNPNNRVAIVHYGGLGSEPNNNVSPRIYIEDPFSNGAFTNNLAEATNYSNRYGLQPDDVGTGDFAHEALGLIGDALDNVTNPLIVSPQKQLNHNNSSNLVLFFFNDGFRGFESTWLVNVSSSTPNSNAAFLNYTNFKVNRNATIVVTTAPGGQAGMDLPTQEANAAIASYGLTGNYAESIESYPAEPSNNAFPRLYNNSNSFLLNSDQIGDIVSDICFAGSNCPDVINLFQPVNNVSVGQDEKEAIETIEAENVIFTNATAIYHAGNEVILTEGFEAEAGSRFAAYIEGCTDDFVYENEAIEDKPKGDINKFRMSPNPANSHIYLSIIQGDFSRITITSVDGRRLIDKTIKPSKKYELDISKLNSGMYYVTIYEVNGARMSKQLIKK